MIDFDKIPHLLPQQVDACYQAAVDRVRKYNGERPDIKKFARQRREELGGLFQPVDGIMFLLFVVLFVFSLLHLIAWAQREAVASYLHSINDLISPSIVDGSENIQISLDRFGLTISQSLYVLLHQISILGFSELGLIFLSIVHVNSRKSGLRQGKSNIISRFVYGYISVYSILALLVSIVIFAANVSSQFNPLVAMLVPATTIVISERLANLFALKLERDSLIIVNFREKSSEWEQVDEEPEKHSKFLKFYSEAILAYYKQNIFPRREELKNLALDRRSENYLAGREIHRSLVNDTDLELAIRSFERNPREGHSEAVSVSPQEPSVSDAVSENNPDNEPAIVTAAVESKVAANPRKQPARKNGGKSKPVPKKITQADLLEMIASRPILAQRLLNKNIKGAELAKELFPEDSANAIQPAYRLIYAIDNNEDYRQRLSEVVASQDVGNNQE